MFSILYGFVFPAQGGLHETTVLRTNDIGKDLCYTIHKPGTVFPYRRGALNLMRFALVDDAAAERETAGRLFSSFAEEMHTEFEVDMFDSGEAFLAAFVPYTYDIVFMDIYMGGMSGIDTARKMRESDSRSLLIFLTSSGDHMGQAFSVHAFDYMEKPLDRNKFFTCLTDSLALLPKPEDYLSFSSNGLDIRLFYSEIACLSSCGHSTVVQCTSGKEYTVYSAFSVFTKPLTEDGRFLLVSRGILVNMDHITGFQGNNCLLKNDLSVPVTQRKLRQLIQAWHNYNFTKFYNSMPERN